MNLELVVAFAAECDNEAAKTSLAKIRPWKEAADPTADAQ